jgi:glycosyltransferase involved in cell wall biosynthesis
MRPVCYAFGGGTLGGSGIGRIAGHAAEGLHRGELLDSAVVLDAADVDIPAERLTTLPGGHLLKRIPHARTKDACFDFISSAYVDAPKLFHGWNLMCLRSLRKADARDATTVVERASTHPNVQRDLIETEYDEFGVSDRPFTDREFERAVTELAECDAVFVPSEFVYDSFKREGFSDDSLFTIPFGVDTDAFTPPADPARRDSEFTALFTGQISLRKGIQYLLPAWEQADVDGTLRIAGETTSTAESVVDDYRNNEDIEFLGWVDDMEREYERASAFVFPSIEEGSALVSYEAMAAGLPSIVTPNVGSLVRDERDGLVVPPRSPDAVADALERLAAEPSTRAEFGRSARQRVEDYTWERYGDSVAEAHRELLDERT